MLFKAPKSDWYDSSKSRKPRARNIKRVSKIESYKYLHFGFLIENNSQVGIQKRAALTIYTDTFVIIT